MTAHTVLMLLVAYLPTFFTDLSISKPLAIVFTYILDISCLLVVVASYLRFLAVFLRFLVGSSPCLCFVFVVTVTIRGTRLQSLARRASMDHRSWALASRMERKAKSCHWWMTTLRTFWRLRNPSRMPSWNILF